MNYKYLQLSKKHPQITGEVYFRLDITNFNEQQYGAACSQLEYGLPEHLEITEHVSQTPKGPGTGQSIIK